MIKNAAIYGVFSLSNFFNTFCIEEGYFGSEKSSFPLIHLWSLSVEEQFYLVWPLLMIIFTRISNGRKVIWLLGLIFTSTLSAQVFYYYNQSIAYYMLVNRMGEMLIGALLNFLPLLEYKKHNELMGLMGLIFSLYSLFFINSESVFPGFNTLIPCLGASFLIHSNHQQNTITYKILSFSPLVNVGLVSYSAYLYHWPVLAISNYFEIAMNYFNTFNLFIIGTILTLFSYNFVEKPIRFSTMSKKVSFIVLFVIPVLIMLSISLYFPTNKTNFENKQMNVTNNLAGVETAPLPEWFDFGKYEWYQMWGGCPICSKDDENICFPMDNDERCGEDVIIKEVFHEKTQRCWRGSQNTSLPTALLVGDSHLVHLIPIFDVFAEALNFKYFGFSKGLTIPCLFESTDQYMSKIVSRLSEFDVVVISAMWQRYNFSCIESTIDKLLEMNKKVLLVGDTPFFPDLKKQCPNQQPPINPLFEWCIKSKPLKEFDIVKKNLILQNISFNKKGVLYWDFNDVLCPLGVCKSYYRTVRMYADDSHLNYGFSELAAKDYVENNGVPWQLTSLFS